MFHRFFSRKAKSPDAKSKTPEPPIRSDVSDKSTKTLSMNKASSRPPQIRISNVKLFIFICLSVCLFVRPCIIVQSFRFELTKHKEKLFPLPPQTDLKVVPPQIPERNAPKAMSVLTGSGVEAIGNEIFDTECLKLMNEYFYGVRIFPGQDPTHVYVGWVTSQYHLHTKDFNLSRVRKGSVVITDDYDRPVEQ